ncbi:MAG: type II toxin-antitoxin system mRNA interferase toxin, RelE/StbE family [Candidatus Curtissbacteria bacterium]|nr:type II toxin-antitoxin system mRNA interferase toxin, RelE/StbE family [Candidatus Curtissbacteria bacterium]
MIVHLHKNFKKHYKKLTESQKRKFKDRRNLFIQDEFDPVLNNHALKGKYLGYRSINITGDIRVIFKKDSEGALFVAIDSHSNLYG